jgi:hypothetical protein
MFGRRGRIVDDATIENWAQEAQVAGLPLVEWLQWTGELNTAQLAEIGAKFGIEHQSESIDFGSIPFGLEDQIPEDTARKFRVLPLEVQPGKLTAVISDPSNQEGIRGIQAYSTIPVIFVTAELTDFIALFDAVYGGSLRETLLQEIPESIKSRVSGQEDNSAAASPQFIDLDLSGSDVVDFARDTPSAFGDSTNTETNTESSIVEIAEPTSIIDLAANLTVPRRPEEMPGTQPAAPPENLELPETDKEAEIISEEPEFGDEDVEMESSIMPAPASEQITPLQFAKKEESDSAIRPLPQTGAIKEISRGIIDSITASANDRESVGTTLLQLMGVHYESAGIFIVSKQTACGWMASGSTIRPDALRSARVPLQNPSFFRVAARSKRPYHGQIVHNPENDIFLKTFSAPPESVTVLPIFMRKRIFGFLFGNYQEDHYNLETLRVYEYLAAQAGKMFERIFPAK